MGAVDNWIIWIISSATAVIVWLIRLEARVQTALKLEPKVEEVVKQVISLETSRAVADEVLRAMQKDISEIKNYITHGGIEKLTNRIITELDLKLMKKTGE